MDLDEEVELSSPLVGGAAQDSREVNPGWQPYDLQERVGLREQEQFSSSGRALHGGTM